MLYLILNTALEKPFNLGILLKSGVCPHSNQGATHPQDLEFCQFDHLQEVVHFPDPFHLQSLFEVFLDQKSGFKLFNDNIILKL
jgi:hypothetical protein